jgi:hypothetical protein
MSLRETLKQAVAGCTPLGTQHATFNTANATGNATAVQQLAANPHGIRAGAAIRLATSVQPERHSNATSDEKLHVAFAMPCNTQPGPLTAPRVLAELIQAAMHACDHWNDSETAREEMRHQCNQTPPHLRGDLLAHFRAAYGGVVGGSADRTAASQQPCGP